MGATSKISVRGSLDTAIRKNNEISITDKDGTAYWVKVEAGMDDLVRNNFGSQVNISGLLKMIGNKKRIEKPDIFPLDSSDID